MHKLKKKQEIIQEENEIDKLLSKYGLKRKPLPKDGSCLFRAIAEEVYHTQTKHPIVRKNCVLHIQKNRKFFENYIFDTTFEKYCINMRKQKTWGDQLCVEACAQFYK